MNFILKFLQKKSIRIAELEKAAESHARIVGDHKAAHTRKYCELDDKYAKALALIEREGLKEEVHRFEPTKPLDVEETMEQPVIRT